MLLSTPRPAPANSSAPAPAAILCLSQDVVNRIAAGEVIQRPSSALKELLENSLDAGATRISILVGQGGLGLLQITDNGHGIRPADFPLLCERFATSKLRTFDDLFNMSTFGFRGEALASISHVAHQVAVVSRARDATAAGIGFTAHFRHGKMVEAEPAPTAFPDASGTTISVESLFYASPLRKSVFSKHQDELGRICEVTERYALAYPWVNFTVRKHEASHAADVCVGGVCSVACTALTTSLQRSNPTRSGPDADAMVDSELATKGANGAASLAPQLHEGRRAVVRKVFGGDVAQRLRHTSVSHRDAALKSPFIMRTGAPQASGEPEEVGGQSISAIPRGGQSRSTPSPAMMISDRTTTTASSPFTCDLYFSDLNYKGKRTLFTLFVNQRWVESPNLRRALETCYSRFLVAGSKPFLLLFLQVDPQTVDVNVHPTKQEVLLLHEDVICRAVFVALQRCLEAQSTDGARQMAVAGRRGGNVVLLPQQQPPLPLTAVANTAGDHNDMGRSNAGDAAPSPAQLSLEGQTDEAADTDRQCASIVREARAVDGQGIGEKRPRGDHPGTEDRAATAVSAALTSHAVDADDANESRLTIGPPTVIVEKVAGQSISTHQNPSPSAIRPPSDCEAVRLTHQPATPRETASALKSLMSQSRTSGSSTAVRNESAFALGGGASWGGGGQSSSNNLLPSGLFLSVAPGTVGASKPSTLQRVDSDRGALLKYLVPIATLRQDERKEEAATVVVLDDDDDKKYPPQNDIENASGCVSSSAIVSNRSIDVDDDDGPLVATDEMRPPSANVVAIEGGIMADVPLGVSLAEAVAAAAKSATAAGHPADSDRESEDDDGGAAAFRRMRRGSNANHPATVTEMPGTTANASMSGTTSASGGTTSSIFGNIRAPVTESDLAALTNTERKTMTRLLSQCCGTREASEVAPHVGRAPLQDVVTSRVDEKEEPTTHEPATFPRPALTRPPLLLTSVQQIITSIEQQRHEALSQLFEPSRISLMGFANSFHFFLQSGTTLLLVDGPLLAYHIAYQTVFRRWGRQKVVSIGASTTLHGDADDSKKEVVVGAKRGRTGTPGGGERASGTAQPASEAQGSSTGSQQATGLTIASLLTTALHERALRQRSSSSQPPVSRPQTSKTARSKVSGASEQVAALQWCALPEVWVPDDAHHHRKVLAPCRGEVAEESFCPVRISTGGGVDVKSEPSLAPNEVVPSTSPLQPRKQRTLPFDECVFKAQRASSSSSSALKAASKRDQTESPDSRATTMTTTVEESASEAATAATPSNKWKQSYLHPSVVAQLCRRLLRWSPMLWEYFGLQFTEPPETTVSDDDDGADGAEKQSVGPHRPPPGREPLHVPRSLLDGSQHQPRHTAADWLEKDGVVVVDDDDDGAAPVRCGIASSDDEDSSPFVGKTETLQELSGDESPRRKVPPRPSSSNTPAHSDLRPPDAWQTVSDEWLLSSSFRLTACPALVSTGWPIVAASLPRLLLGLCLCVTYPGDPVAPAVRPVWDKGDAAQPPGHERKRHTKGERTGTATSDEDDEPSPDRLTGNGEGGDPSLAVLLLAEQQTFRVIANLLADAAVSPFFLVAAQADAARRAGTLGIECAMTRSSSWLSDAVRQSLLPAAAPSSHASSSRENGFIPTTSLVSDRTITIVTTVEELYKVFERC